MKKLLSVFLILAPILLPAQVGVGLAVNQESYLLYENILAKLTVRNLSGKALIFGEDDRPGSPRGYVEFTIHGPGGINAEKKNINYNPMSGFVMAPGTEQTILVPVNKLYVLDKPGAYSIKAIVGHSSLGGAYETGTTSFTIFNGVTLWEKELGVPKLYHKEGAAEPLPRTVKLLSFYDKENKYVAIMVEDKDKVYNVRRLGYDTGNVKPKIETDMLNRTHVLLQISPSVYVHYVLDINCELEQKDVYSKTDTSPTFVLDPEEGSILVVGGRKAMKDVDYVEENGMPVMKEEL